MTGGRRAGRLGSGALPKKLDGRGPTPDSRAIGIYGHSAASFVDDAPAIRGALAAKHHEYGDLNAPFVIAIGTYMMDSDRRHARNAMYGQLAFEFDPNSVEPPTRAIRQADGYFGTPPDWQNHNVSGSCSLTNSCRITSSARRSRCGGTRAPFIRCPMSWDSPRMSSPLMTASLRKPLQIHLLGSSSASRTRGRQARRGRHATDLTLLTESARRAADLDNRQYG